MIAVQLDMFDLMVRAAEIWPVKPNGSVVKGTPDHILRLRHPKFASDIATIEVHRCRKSGKWMWSTAFHIHHSGSGYKVGPKWGKFASSASDALHWAKAELCQGIHNRASAEENLKIKAWAEQIALEPRILTRSAAQI